MRPLGIILLALGALGLIFAMSMDTSVSTGMGRVNNLGLMNDQQNYIIISAILLIAGLLTSLAGVFAGSAAERPEASDVPKSGSTPKERACPFCAESIKVEAIKCRFCNSDVEAMASRCSYCSQMVYEPNKPCPAWGEHRLQECADISQDPVCLQALATRGFTPSSA